MKVRPCPNIFSSVQLYFCNFFIIQNLKVSRSERELDGRLHVRYMWELSSCTRCAIRACSPFALDSVMIDEYPIRTTCRLEKLVGARAASVI